MNTRKKFGLLSGLVVGIFVFSVLTVQVYARWSKQYTFGRVTKTHDSELVLEIPTVGYVPVRISERTAMRRGGAEVPLAELMHETVMVAGVTGVDGVLEAKVVRVVKPKALR